MTIDEQSDQCDFHDIAGTIARLKQLRAPIIHTVGHCVCCGRGEGERCTCGISAARIRELEQQVAELKRQLAAACEESASRGSRLIDLEQQVTELRKQVEQYQRMMARGL